VARPWLRAFALLSLLAAHGELARAEDPSDEVAPVTSRSVPEGIFGPRSGPPVGVELSIEQEWKETFVAYPGSVAVNRELATLWVAAGIDPVFVKLELDAESSNYLFEDTRRLLIGTNDPAPETLCQGTATAKVYVLLDPWVLYIAPTLRFGGALDAPFGDALRYGVDVAARYTVDPDLKLTLGAGTITRLEAHPLFYPIVGIQYGRLEVDIVGATLLATFGVLPSLDARFSAGIDYRDFRLPHGSSLPLGVLRDEDAPVRAGLGWKPITGLEADLDVGAVVWRKLVIDDHYGGIVAKARANPGAFVAFKLVLQL
jgi:hypothetical protein